VLWLRNIFSSFVPRLSDVFGSFITRLSHALIGRKSPFGRYRNTRLLKQSSSRCGGVDTVFEFGHFFTDLWDCYLAVLTIDFNGPKG
jgi:hypothetical protein